MLRIVAGFRFAWREALRMQMLLDESQARLSQIQI
jgi:hypothetical protein